jgi:glucose-fructose oxidoreductase
MVGYRLHFERANLEAVRTLKSGRLGRPRFLHSAFGTDVAPGNLRLREGEGGPLYDIGIYCLNAAATCFGPSPRASWPWPRAVPKPASRRFPRW